MKTRASFLAALILPLSLMASPGRAQVAPDCEAFRCEFQQRLDQECSCSEATNHGRYVSCVAHIVSDLTAEGLPTSCKGKLTRCAARSVCGKQARGFFTCTTFTYGTCVIADPALPGACEHDPAIACTADTDCVTSSRCRISRDAERCEADGGFVNLAPTCCSTCQTAP